MILPIGWNSKRTVYMAAIAVRRQSAEIARSVAVVTGERAMQTGQVAADCRVIKTGRCKRPLRMALAAPGRQRIAVNVILSVAIDTEVARARKLPAVDMASLTREPVVGSPQRKISHVMQRLDVAKRGRIVAGFTPGSELPSVNVRFGMASSATETGCGPRFERNPRMALCASRRQMRAVQGELRLRIVVKNILSGLQMTCLAALA